MPLFIMPKRQIAPALSSVWRVRDRHLYSSRVQQPWHIQMDAGGRIGTSYLLKPLVRVLLPVATDQPLIPLRGAVPACKSATIWPFSCRNPSIYGLEGQPSGTRPRHTATE